jgi:hypothetical protein
MVANKLDITLSYFKFSASKELEDLVTALRKHDKQLKIKAYTGGVGGAGWVPDGAVLAIIASVGSRLRP